MKRFPILLLLAVIVPFVHGIEGSRVDRAALSEKITDSIETDDNRDGRPEYRLSIDGRAQKIEEVLDTNQDGEMDDFSYYRSGVLYFRELDTNYDGAVDIWVYIREGVYVERYERDKDFDGKVDLVKDYGKAK